MGTQIGRALVAGAVMWAGLTACSEAVFKTPAADGPVLDSPPRAWEPATPPGAPVALVWDTADNSHYLTRLRPRTLGTRDVLDLGPRAQRAGAFSPDGEALLLVTTKGRARVVEVRRMTTTARYAMDMDVVYLAWIDDDTAVAAVAPGAGTTGFVFFDPRTGEVARTEEVPLRTLAYERVRGGVVALLYEHDRGAEPSPTTLARVDAHRGVETAPLDGIESGYFLPEGEKVHRRLEPALAVRGDDAVVVGTDGAIVAVDLRTLRVDAGAGDVSLFEQAAAWFVPPAHAKGNAGATVRAEWIGRHELLVTGVHTEVTQETEYSFTEHPTRAGASILDTRDWSARLLDEEASLAVAAGDLVLASHDFIPGDKGGDGIGLRAYDRGGQLAWKALGSSFADVLAVRGGLVLVRHGWKRALVSSVDLDTGRVLATTPLSPSLPDGVPTS